VAAGVWQRKGTYLAKYRRRPLRQPSCGRSPLRPWKLSIFVRLDSGNVSTELESPIARGAHCWALRVGIDELDTASLRWRTWLRSEEEHPRANGPKTLD
jgi:hypothetical protein